MSAIKISDAISEMKGNRNYIILWISPRTIKAIPYDKATPDKLLLKPEVCGIFNHGIGTMDLHDEVMFSWRVSFSTKGYTAPMVFV